MRFNNQQPRYDMHYIVDFREASPDAELVVQVWDKDKHGGDDFISEVRLASIDVRRLCQRKSKFQDFKLQAAGANPSKKEKRLAAGAHDPVQRLRPVREPPRQGAGHLPLPRGHEVLAAGGRQNRPPAAGQGVRNGEEAREGARGFCRLVLWLCVCS